MYTPPLHRKLIPWIYTALFFVVAPVVVFYTAGYRYNTKKAAIEKRGTLIVDSEPEDATVILDGQDTRSRTPAVFQELTPGWHQVRFEKEGYVSWEKTLEIRAERVTFADHARLWRTEPEISLTLAGSFARVAANPDRDTLAALETGAASGTAKLLLLQPNGRVSLETPVSVADAQQTVLSWEDGSRALLLDGPGGHDTAVRFLRAGATATTTPAQATWQDEDLVASRPGTLWRWNSRTGLALTDELATSVRQRVGTFVLPQAPTGSAQLLLDRTFSSRAFALPDGWWTFGYVFPDALVLRDGKRWLGLNPQQTSSFLGLLEGQPPRWRIDEGTPTTRGLLFQENELWLWPLGEEPILLVRQSEPLVATAWHESGDAVLVATRTSLDVLDLDERGGRMRHTLATFDEIRDVDALNGTIYVAGKKEGTDGLWTVVAE